MEDDARFWKLIERATPRSGAGTEDHAEAVQEALTRLPVDELIDFQITLDRHLARAYRWDLWAVAYIALGGCSDDGFEYFRLWLVAQGRDYFERALLEPERAADALSPGDEGECESLAYAAAQAYEDSHDGEFPYVSPASSRRDPAGEPWPEADVGALYPALTARFG